MPESLKNVHYPFLVSAGYQCPDYNNVAKINWPLQ